MSGFVNHHVHSHFSALDGLPSPERIVETVVGMGQTSVSLTDHGDLSGIPSMYRAAKEAGIGFTPGCEMYFAPDRTYAHPDRLGEKYYHMILLAYNNTGYENLVKMQTTAWWDGYYHKPRIDWEVLEQHHEGLIGTTACLGGIVNQHLLRGDMDSAKAELGRMVDIFGVENTFVEIQNHGLPEQEKILGQQVELARWSGAELLAACDSHYCCEGEHDLHDSLLCASTGATKDQDRRFRFDSDQFFLHSADQMNELFPDHMFPRAVSNTVAIAERNEFTLKIDDDKEYLMPSVTTKKGMTEAETLREHVLAGAMETKRYGDENGDIPDHVMERIDYELGVVEGMGFSGYFLIVENIVKLFADNDIIVGPGRGSAPGSVLVYCLGITDVDPFAHGLFFERFLNPDRISMPDIDIDVPKSKRKKALLLMEEEYGKGHVAHLSNYNTMAIRDALTRASKVYGLSATEANKLTSVLAQYSEGHKVSLDELADRSVVIPPSVINELPRVEPKTLHNIIVTAAAFEGAVVSSGVHASGILITHDPVDEHFPLRKSKNSVLPVCQFDGNDVEALGGVKMDILGLKNLDECENTERNILLDLGEEVDSSRVPLDDEEVFDLLSTGESGGIFQLGCLSGDTIIEGDRLSDLYQRRHSTSFPNSIRSVYLGEGEVAPNNILKVVHTGKKNLTSITTDDGATLEATADHKVFTRRGWVAVSDLREGLDRVLRVNNNVGDSWRPGSVRARVDIIEIFEKNVSGVTRNSDNHPVNVGVSDSFYPTFHVDGTDDTYVFIHPDQNLSAALRIQEEAHREGVNIITYSYSQVIEMIYGADQGRNLVLPLGTEWSTVIDIKRDYRVDDTYDIMMRSPVNNYIANGIMVHNSGGMQKLLRRLRPTNLADIAALLALYRPGPMGANTHNEYSDRKNGLKELSVDHEVMLDILSDTYGLIVFQEDVMSLSRELAGYTGAEADNLRKATAKKNQKMMEPHEKKFIPTVNERYGNKLGDVLWSYILPFSDYGFCKAHAVAYGRTTYRTAWLKAHYPAQFAAAVIDDSLKDRDSLIETIVWSKKMGVKVNYPSVKYSSTRSVTTRDEVILPITIVSGMGDELTERIISEREHGEFTSVIDFMSRTRTSPAMMVKLAKAGFFDDFSISRAAIVSEIDQITSIAKTQQSRSVVTSGLFGEFIDDDDDDELIDLSTDPEEILEGDNIVRVDSDLYAKWERESIGFILGRHPYKTIREMRVSAPILRQYPPMDMFTRAVDNARFSGIISDINNRVSKKGNDFCSFSLETDMRVVSSVAFSHIPETLNGAMVLGVGKIENDNEGNDGEFSPHAVLFEMSKVDVDKLKKKEEETK